MHLEDVLVGHEFEGIRVRADGSAETRAVLRDEHIRYRANRFDGPAGVYEDRAADYVTSEPAVVYAASAVRLFAAMAG
jgi:hypothetical protein